MFLFGANSIVRSGEVPQDGVITLVELQNVKLTGMPGGKVIVNAGELGKPFRAEIVRRVELFAVMRTGRMICES